MRTSIQLLIAEANAEIPDNASQLVTPAKVRTLFQNILETLAPAYGALAKAGPALAVLGAVPALINAWTTLIRQTAPEWSVNLAAGTAQRVLGTTLAALSRITANGSVEGPNGANVTATLFKNGAATPFSVSVNCTGVGDPVSFNLTGLSYDILATTFDLRVSTNNPGNYTFTNLVLICENVPVDAF
jgi:hypothetical protein